MSGEAPESADDRHSFYDVYLLPNLFRHYDLVHSRHSAVVQAVANAAKAPAASEAAVIAT